MTTDRLRGKTPEEISEILELPLQRALIDFDLQQPVKQVIGADPIDLTDIPTIPVKTLITAGAVFTIMAHPGSEQDVADVFHARPEMAEWAASYAADYLEKGVMEFAFYALEEHQIRNVEHNTGSRLERE